MRAEIAHKITDLPILFRIWQADDVWNVSAFDIPVVAYGDSVTEAQSNFEDALESHFEALSHFHELDGTIQQLREVASADDFYPARLTPGVMVEKFSPSSHRDTTSLYVA